MEIPRTIHYCWFGRRPLPASAQKCIDSWRRYFPGYAICEWNESNFDTDALPFTRQAYAAKKYAFVSDCARFEILYRLGGLYFDTDVEVIRPMDDVLKNGPFLGCEIDGGEGGRITVSPGLGMAALPGMPFYKTMLDTYRAQRFLLPDGAQNTKTVCLYTTEALRLAGLADVPGIQRVAGIAIYPKEYFNPLNDLTGRVTKTENTRSIHWYAKTWLSPCQILRNRLSRLLHRAQGKYGR